MGAPGRLKCYSEEEKNQIRAEIQYLSELKECGLLKLDDPARVERFDNENIQELKVNFRQLLQAYEYQREVKEARKGKGPASDSETEDTRQGPGPSNQLSSEPDNPTLTSEEIGRRNIFSDIFTVTPNLSARDNINPLFGELNQNPEVGTAEGEQELDPVGSAARLRVGWDPNPVPSEGPDWNSTPSWREGGTPGGNNSPRDTPRGTPGSTPGNTPRSSPTPEGLPTQPTAPHLVVIPDPTAVPGVTPDPIAVPVPAPGLTPVVPLPPIRIPPVNPVHIVPPPSVPIAPTRLPSTVPVNPFVNPWVQPAPRVPGQGRAEPSVVPRRPAAVNSHPTVPDDFEDKLKTCAYSMAYRDGAFNNERDAYRRSDQDSEDEHSDDSSGTRKKKRYLREQRTEQKLVNHWKKALSSIGKDRAQQNTPAPMRYSHDTRVCYYNAKNSQARRKDVPIHAIEGVTETPAREEPRRNFPRRNYGEGSSQQQTGQLECYYCYEKGHIKRNCILFKKHMDERRTSKTPHVAGSNAIYVELKDNKSVSVMTREMRRQALEPDVIPDSIPNDDLTSLRRWDKKDQVTKDTIDFIQEMQTSDEQEDVEVGNEGDYFPFNNMEPPEDDPNPVNTAIPENVWKKNRRRRTENEPSNPGKRVRFTIEVEEPQAVEEIAKKLTEKFLQQKAEITMQELFNLASYCKELMLRRLMVIPKSVPDDNITDEGVPDDHLPNGNSIPDDKNIPDGTNSEPDVGVASIAPWMDIGPVLQIQVKGMRLLNILIDGGSGANVISAELYEKLKDTASHPTPFNLKMTDQRRVLPLGMVKNLPIRIKDMSFDIDVVVLPKGQTKGQVPMILGRPWLRHNNVRHEWDLTNNFVELV
ncbi:hypothetical protein R1sor_013903 [Riccia sorocarpa]|uniref:CCHC-type domain-containing protein n=1 Tax=Riccia sorocarpa TaxID=122646 RepID=A0ABD3HBR4_9MARC